MSIISCIDSSISVINKGCEGPYLVKILKVPKMFQKTKEKRIANDPESQISNSGIIKTQKYTENIQNNLQHQNIAYFRCRILDPIDPALGQYLP